MKSIMKKNVIEVEYKNNIQFRGMFNKEFTYIFICTVMHRCVAFCISNQDYRSILQ
jgi:hypothetical protein